ncbi:MAG: hypothetical protein DRJ50_13040, partial [Actinobacteria bacterium]
MLRLFTARPLIICAAMLFCVAAAPGQAEDDPSPSSDEAVLSEDEIARTRAYYESADLRTRAELSAYYEDLGIDIEELIGISSEQQASQALAQAITASLGEL